jgi:hypothetical protein
MRNQKYYTFAPAAAVALMLLLVCATQGLADDKKPAPPAKAAAPAPRPAAPAPAPRAAAPAPAPRPGAPAAAPAARPSAPFGAPAARPTAPTPGPGGPGARPNFPAPAAAPGGVRPGSPGAAPGNVRPGTPAAAPGRQFGGNPEPGRQFGNGTPGRPAAPAVRPLSNGGQAHYNPAGRPTEISRPGFRAERVGEGPRRVVIERPGGVRVVAYGRGGYVTHGFVSHGQSFERRSYYVNGRAYPAFYHPYGYRGVNISIYAPARYYAPGFYGYAYRPWGVPVVYTGWGWDAAPWYPMYGGFFTPYPSYAAPNFWLTDYMVAASLQSAYQAGQDSVLANGGAPPMTNNFSQAMSPDLKNQIAGEVQYQLQRQQSEAQLAAANQLPAPAGLPIFDNRLHTLQVYTSVNAIAASGGECPLTESDIVEFNGVQPADGVNASVSVRFSKAQDCQSNSIVSVPVEQLQEMSNHMMEVMEQGLAEFQKTQGRNGIPVSNVSFAQTAAPFASDVPAAEPNVQSELQQASQQGDAAFNEASSASGPGSGTSVSGGPQPNNEPTYHPGQTLQQIIGLLGVPKRQASSGARLIYFYKDMKITFENGVVSEIE